jgi:Arc/MetJ-type ribon-helix-helix transcriptional regulator
MSGLITIATSPQLVSPEKESLGRRIPKALRNAADRLVDSLKVSSVSEQVRRGRRIMSKRRTIYSAPLAELANVYFRMAGIPIRFWAKTEDWQRWEVKSFNMLNGDRFQAQASGASVICADKLPGRSLSDRLNEGTLTREMTEAAGHELRRAHQLWSDEFRGLWSHGDAGTNNMLYDEKSGRVRLIDFEIVHQKSLPAKSRHADDLLVFLLDILALAPNRRWLTLVLAFLNAYDNAAVIAHLKNQLAVPTGMAWIWWGVRTSFANPAKVKRRLHKLRDLAAYLEHYRAFAAKRARHTRRASITCHAIKPGIPRINSRTRAINESAKAASPGMPRRLPTST